MKHPVHKVHQTFIQLNESKFFVGILMIIMNIGSKYIMVKMSNSQEAYMRNNVAREVIIFCACWLGTRDIYVSIILTASFFILTEHFFNEESCLCVIPKRFRSSATSQTVTKEELTRAMETLTKAVNQMT